MSKEINQKAVELTDDEAEKAAGGSKPETMSLMQCPDCLQWFSVSYVPGKTYVHENCPGHYEAPTNPSKPKDKNNNNNQDGRLNQRNIT